MARKFLIALKKFFRLLFGKPLENNTIPKDFLPNEQIVRAIFEPLHYSKRKKKLKREALLPPHDSDEVSVLRIEFSNIQKCKSHIRNVRLKEYIGFAKFLASDVNKITTENKNAPVHFRLVFSPLDENREKRDDIENITKNDAGVPVHADLVYSLIVEKGQPATYHRILANSLLKKCQAFEDPNSIEEDWGGERVAI